jgi:hypothetical protein
VDAIAACLLAASAKTDRKNVSSALCGASRRASEDAYVADDVFRDVRPYPKKKYGSGALEGGSGHQTNREGSPGINLKVRGMEKGFYNFTTPLDCHIKLPKKKKYENLRIVFQY